MAVVPKLQSAISNPTASSLARICPSQPVAIISFEGRCSTRNGGLSGVHCGNDSTSYRIGRCPRLAAGCSTNSGRHRRIASKALTCRPNASATQEFAFEFSDEGSVVEVRVPIPPALQPVSVRQVGVDIQADSLLVTLATPDKLDTLLVARPLFGLVQPADSTWYLDDDEVLVQLHKSSSPGQGSTSTSRDSNSTSSSSSSSSSGSNGSNNSGSTSPWPSLLRARASLCTAVARQLAGCSVFLIGSDTAVNETVGGMLAADMGYAHVHTASVLQQALGQTVEQVAAAEGWQEVVRAEEAVLQQLASTVRVLVSTVGFPHELGITDDRWRFLQAGITVQLIQQGVPSHTTVSLTTPDCSVDVALHSQNASDLAGASAAHEPAQAAAVDASVGAVAVAAAAAVDAELLASAAAEKLHSCLVADPQIPGKKGLYMRLGCRGDWPDLLPPV